MRSMEIMVNRLSEVSHENADVNIEVCIDGEAVYATSNAATRFAGVGYRTVMGAAPALAEAMPYI